MSKKFWFGLLFMTTFSFGVAIVSLINTETPTHIASMDKVEAIGISVTNTDGRIPGGPDVHSKFEVCIGSRTEDGRECRINSVATRPGINHKEVMVRMSQAAAIAYMEQAVNPQRP